MEGIYETNADFDFNKLTLTTPTVMSGGNYFIKYLMNAAPLYIQPPKCKTKGGLSKSGKRMYCDLVFTNENEQFIRWMEDLENYTCNYIYKNREKWFETDMELPDIENYFTSPLKIYKSGKFYLARTNIGTRLGKISLKIYDESEEPVDPESISDNTNIITILEVQGIKCSARSFQIELEMKQMMVVRSNDDLFEKCLIGATAEKPAAKIPVTLVKSESETTVEPPAAAEEITLEEKNVDSEPISLVQDIIEVNEEAEPDGNDLKEYEIDLDKVEELESVKIKPRNDVYYEIYREARRKAKLARKMALSAYLEAKQIKNTYMLDDIEDSEESESRSRVEMPGIPMDEPNTRAISEPVVAAVPGCAKTTAIPSYEANLLILVGLT